MFPGYIVEQIIQMALDVTWNTYLKGLEMVIINGHIEGIWFDFYLWLFKMLQIELNEDTEWPP